MELWLKSTVASKVKKNGIMGSLLNRMADRGGNMTSDYRGFPPSWVFWPAERKGYVTMARYGLPKSKYTVWSLTDKGWKAIGRNKPFYEVEE
jgi:hypothetical protein